MDPETQKLLQFNQETKQIVEELLQIFQRTEKNLVLLQQTNRIVQKLLEIFHKVYIRIHSFFRRRWRGRRRTSNRQKGGLLPLAALVPAFIAAGKAIGFGALGGGASFGAKKL